MSRRRALMNLGTWGLTLVGCQTSRTTTDIETRRHGRKRLFGKDLKVSIDRKPWGQLPDGRPVQLFTLSNGHGFSAKISEFGGILTELHVPDRKGKPADVVLGFDNLDPYLKGHPFFGAITGRFANRIRNGRFTLDGITHQLDTGGGRHHIHGGPVGFDKQLWTGTTELGKEGSAMLVLRYLSPDGDQRFPGNLDVTVRYRLTLEDELQLEYEAVTDKPTIINLTNHSYFNLAGGGGDVLGHILRLGAKRATRVDADLVPTGELDDIRGTALDFTWPHAIGERHARAGLAVPGYDHNYVLDHGGGELGFAAEVYEPRSGRVMEVLTTEPGVQLYTANHMDGSVTGKAGWRYPRFGGFCLETQHFPDSPNHSHFPSVVLRPGQKFASRTVFRFSTRN